MAVVGLRRGAVNKLPLVERNNFSEAASLDGTDSSTASPRCARGLPRRGAPKTWAERVKEWHEGAETCSDAASTTASSPQLKSQVPGCDCSSGADVSDRDSHEDLSPRSLTRPPGVFAAPSTAAPAPERRGPPGVFVADGDAEPRVAAKPPGVFAKPPAQEAAGDLSNDKPRAAATPPGTFAKQPPQGPSADGGSEIRAAPTLPPGTFATPPSQAPPVTRTPLRRPVAQRAEQPNLTGWQEEPTPDGFSMEGSRRRRAHPQMRWPWPEGPAAATAEELADHEESVELLLAVLLEPTRG